MTAGRTVQGGQQNAFEYLCDGVGVSTPAMTRGVHLTTCGVHVGLGETGVGTFVQQLKCMSHFFFGWGLAVTWAAGEGYGN